jgi:hypothetical protein
MFETWHDVACDGEMLGHLGNRPLGTGLGKHRLIIGHGDFDFGGSRIDVIN